MGRQSVVLHCRLIRTYVRACPNLGSLRGMTSERQVPIHILVQWEAHTHNTAPADLESLKVVDAATLLLYDILVDNKAAADMESVDGRRKMAIAHLSTIMLRTSRACMHVIATGYVQEAVSLKRRITEASHHTEKVRTDVSGEYAKQWLAGKASASSKLARSVGQSAHKWDFYSRGAHADARILPIQPEGEQVKVLLTPDRDQKAANALLTELAIELADQIAIIVRELRDTELVGQERERLDEINCHIKTLKEHWYLGVSEGLDKMARVRTKP
jgi:hypothetical protein